MNWRTVHLASGITLLPSWVVGRVQVLSPVLGSKRVKLRRRWRTRSLDIFLFLELETVTAYRVTNIMSIVAKLFFYFLFNFFSYLSLGLVHLLAGDVSFVSVTESACREQDE